MSLRCATAYADHGELAFETRELPASDGRRVFRVTLRAGASGWRGAASLSLALDAADPFFLIPGFFYGRGGNALAATCPVLGPLDLAKFSSPTWDFSVDRAAAPLVLCREGRRWRGLSAEPGLPDGQEIGLGLAWENGRAELRINLPGFEGPRRHTRCRYHAPSRPVLDLPPGGILELDLSVWDFEGGPQGHRLPLGAIADGLAPKHPPAPLPDARELADCAAHGLLAWHWNEEPGYFVYTAAYDRSVEFNANNKKTSMGWHFESLGFVGGFPVAHGLFWHAARAGDARAATVAERVVDRWCRDGLSDWGFFRTSYHPGRAWTRNGSFANGAGTGVANADPTGDTPFYGSCWQPDQNWIHARSTADASLYLARLLVLVGPGHARHTDWKRALRRSLDAALSVQDADGRFGWIYHLGERRVLKSEGCAGLLWIPALADALPLFGDEPAFQATVRDALARAGRGYLPDLASGVMCGGPEDTGLAPTSETAGMALMAYAALTRLFGEDLWLDAWRDAADFLLTWRKVFNNRFHPLSILGVYGFRTRGGELASSQNNHVHCYGMNCLADLFELSQRVGDPRYARAADDHFRWSAQLLCRADGHWNGQRGMASEQLYTTDWSIWDHWDPGPDHRQKGTLMGFSHVWCINMMLLGLEQRERQGNQAVPGLPHL